MLLPFLCVSLDSLCLPTAEQHDVWLSSTHIFSFTLPELSVRRRHCSMATLLVFARLFDKSKWEPWKMVLAPFEPASACQNSTKRPHCPAENGAPLVKKRKRARGGNKCMCALSHCENTCLSTARPVSECIVRATFVVFIARCLEPSTFDARVRVVRPSWNARGSIQKATPNARRVSSCVQLALQRLHWLAGARFVVARAARECRARSSCSVHSGHLTPAAVGFAVVQRWLPLSAALAQRQHMHQVSHHSRCIVLAFLSFASWRLETAYTDTPQSEQVKTDGKHTRLQQRREYSRSRPPMLER